MSQAHSPDGTATTLRSLEKEELVRIIMDDARNWLAHDGLWFQAVEAAHGMPSAIAADRVAWERFTEIEAHRIMERLGTRPGGGVPALVECLKHRMSKRKGLPDFPCKTVGTAEYAGFARAVDARIQTRCLCCPPDQHTGDRWCAWEYTTGDERAAP
jgi:hypothetical protein